MGDSVPVLMRWEGRKVAIGGKTAADFSYSHVAIMFPLKPLRRRNIRKMAG